jgi:lauroyl/myristoyl acyltransferase
VQDPLLSFFSLDGAPIVSSEPLLGFWGICPCALRPAAESRFGAFACLSGCGKAGPGYSCVAEAVLFESDAGIHAGATGRSEVKWMSRCRIEGLDSVLRARQNGRPVVLAFLHSSAYRLSRFWLRAAGIPAANLVIGKAETRTRWDRLQDGFSPFPEIPIAFYLDQLREASEFLAAGNALLVAIDAGAVKRVDLPVGEGWTFQMAAGAVRLAIRHRAELIPLVLIDEGHWHYHIKLGRPVSPEYLTAEADWAQAGKHLLDEMLPHFRQHPEQFSKLMAVKFQPPSSPPR